MNRKAHLWTVILAIIVCIFYFSNLSAAENIVIGVPTSTGFLEGKEALKAVNLAVDEINAKGGINVAGEKRALKVETLDIRDAAPGVPVPEALLGIEKIILEKKPTALVVGPFRSEALLAGMDIIAKYKVPLLGTIAMSPASEAKVKQNPEKYKYIFRTCLNAKFLVKYLAGTMAYINKTYGFNKVYIMNQDVAWARKTAEIITKVYFDKAGWEIVGSEAYPTGTSDFSSALMKIRAKGVQVILPIFDMPQSGTMVKQWKAMRIPALMAGFISPLAGPGAWKTFDQKISGAVNCNFELGSACSSDKVPASKAFKAAYQQKYGVPVEAGHGIAPSYESVYILAEAIERAGTTDPDAVVGELEKTDRAGVMGRIKFDEGHQVVYDMDPKASAIAAVLQWKDDGSRDIVFPETIATGKISLPEGLTSVK